MGEERRGWMWWVTKRDDDTSQPKKSNVPHVIVSRSRLRTLRKFWVRAYRSSRLSPPHSHRPYPSTSPPTTPFSNLRVDTPPPTDSQSDPNGPYRLRRWIQPRPTPTRQHSRPPEPVGAQRRGSRSPRAASAVSTSSWPSQPRGKRLPRQQRTKKTLR